MYAQCKCTAIVNKLYYSQFVNALADNDLRRTLQMERVTSLNVAVERARALKVIQEDFERRRGFKKKDRQGSGMAASLVPVGENVGCAEKRGISVLSAPRKRETRFSRVSRGEFGSQI